MPVHRVPTADVEVEVQRIEESERIVEVVSSGDGAVLVFTEPLTVSRRKQPGDRETRA